MTRTLNYLVTRKALGVQRYNYVFICQLKSGLTVALTQKSHQKRIQLMFRLGSRFIEFLLLKKL